jgi:hypothetical protein
MMINEKPPCMLSVTHVAKKGLLPERALRRLVKEGKITTIKSGKTQ